jgi:hypothetical protein
MDYDGLVKSGYLIAGTPDSVARQIDDQMAQIGADHFMGMFHIGDMKHDNVVHSLDLFKQEIMPRFPAPCRTSVAKNDLVYWQVEGSERSCTAGV